MKASRIIISGHGWRAIIWTALFLLFLSGFTFGSLMFVLQKKAIDDQYEDSWGPTPMKFNSNRCRIEIWDCIRHQTYRRDI